MTRPDNSPRTRRGPGFFRLLPVLFFWLIGRSAIAQTVDSEPLPRRCGTTEYEQLLQRRNPARAVGWQRLNRQIEAEQTERGTNTPAGARLAAVLDTQVYRIPVVVHVVHNNAANNIGGTNNPNISDAQIATQLAVLNEDFRRKTNTPGFNTNAVGADTHIEFFLATTDPDGKPTTGITRQYYAQKAVFDVYNSQDDAILLAQLASWPTDRYLNIWVTTLKDVLGFTQLPVATDTLGGLYATENALTDGVRIDYRYFGRSTGTVTSKLYCCGRTTTHEIGHWLGLIHTWGDTNCGNDFVADTPTTQGPNNSASCNQINSTCSPGKTTRNQTENYMDYSPDGCMNLFTVGQRQRMRTVITLNSRRARTAELVFNLSLLLAPNPAQGSTTAQVQTKGSQTYTLTIFDTSGRAVQTLTRANTGSSQFTLPVAGLAAGMYVVQVRSGSETISRRLLIN
jgi:hypothetical protein